MKYDDFTVLTEYNYVDVKLKPAIQKNNQLITSRCLFYWCKNPCVGSNNSRCFKCRTEKITVTKYHLKLYKSFSLTLSITAILICFKHIMKNFKNTNDFNKTKTKLATVFSSGMLKVYYNKYYYNAGFSAFIPYYVFLDLIMMKLSGTQPVKLI